MPAEADKKPAFKQVRVGVREGTVGWPADHQPRDRRDQSAIRHHRQLSGAVRGAAQRGERRLPLRHQRADPAQPRISFPRRHPEPGPLVRQQLQRLPGRAMVHVRRHGAVRRGLDAQGQRARPRRSGLRLGQRPHAHLDRPARRHLLPDADVPHPDLCHLALVRRCLVLRRSVDQRRRPAALAGQADPAGRLRAGGAARRLRNHQVHRGADVPAIGASTPTRSRCNDRFRHPQHGAADVRGPDRCSC